ncbi:MAG: hypothetical protein QGG40_00715 [Myxococcota bacterium]|jgi:hypothetical protein|nr:hypothetical protein [Myxococcota bacterium]
MPEAIPFERLGVPEPLRKNLGPDGDPRAQFAMAAGLLPTTPEAQLALCYVLATHKKKKIALRARKTLVALPIDQVIGALSPKTHPKILEFLTNFRKDDAKLDERLITLRHINDRTAVLLAQRASEDNCSLLARNHERLLMTPDVFVALHANPNCTAATLDLAESFLTLQHCMPEVPPQRPFLATEEPEPTPGPEATATPQPTVPTPSTADTDLEAEIAAALSGDQSPMLLQAQEETLNLFALDEHGQQDLGDFSFDFRDEATDLSWDLTEERDEAATDDEKKSMEAQINDMTVGERVKLAYLGNAEARRLLVRDRNKIVSGAVIKSGRLSDSEVASFAGNRNLDEEVIRLIAISRSMTRKYQVKAALAGNPKTPLPIARQFMGMLSKKDLQNLSRSKSVGGAVAKEAKRLFKARYQK